MRDLAACPLPGHRQLVAARNESDEPGSGQVILTDHRNANAHAFNGNEVSIEDRATWSPGRETEGKDVHLEIR